MPVFENAKKFIAVFIWGLISLTAGFPALLFALPLDGQIVAGQGNIQQPTPQDMVVNQNTQQMIVNWQGFSIANTESVQFKQPGANSIALNRVTGADPSLIMGRLSANGQIFITNPSGVVFGPGSRIDVNGILATTLKISDQDFLDRNYRFFQDPTQSLSSVLNEGNINASSYVGLLAPSVINRGNIIANLGSVALGSGTAATLDFVGDGLINFTITQSVDGTVTDSNGNPVDDRATNEGLIRANGGRVAISAQDAGTIIKNVVNQTGVIEARSVVEKGGRIILSAGVKGLINSGNIDTSAIGLGVSGGDVTLQGGSVVLDGGQVLATSAQGAGGTISLTGTGWVSLGGTVDAGGTSGGIISVNAGGLSVASQVLAKGGTGQGGTITLNTALKSWESSGALIDVSGAAGGTLTHIAGQQITTSGAYLALGTDGPGGQIDVTAPALKFLSDTIDASGATGGGRIRLGGEFQGGKDLLVDEIPNAQYFAMTDGTRINADVTGANGDGGTIIAWSDQVSTVLGQISATPGSLSGSGGFVEVSSADSLTFGGTVVTGIATRPGTFLMDPKNVIIGTASTINQLALILSTGFTGGNVDVAQNGKNINVTQTSKNIDQTLGSDDRFGVATSLDGNRLAVGAFLDDGVANGNADSGAVYLYSFTDSVFNGGVLEAIIGGGYTGGKNVNQALDNNDRFGRGVSLDGNRLAVGAHFDDGIGASGVIEKGAVYLYSFTDSTFSGGNLEAIIGSGFTGGKNINQTLDGNDQFGYSVSLDGNRLAVGARLD
ncbi:MAG: filamentous hemagglutinin N-terminal domain-containing protein, partial [Nitrospinaceae bacterium]